MTENCNRFDDFTTLSHSAERTNVKAGRAGCLLLLLLLRGLKISDTHMRARRRSRQWGRGKGCVYCSFLKEKNWQILLVINFGRTPRQATQRGGGGNAASAVYENKLVSENIKNERGREKLLPQWSNERRAMSKRLKICNKILFSALVKLGQGVCLQMGKVLRAACAASLCLLCPLLLFYFVAGKLIFFSHFLSLSQCLFLPEWGKGKRCHCGLMC